jgi:hypothetical protein
MENVMNWIGILFVAPIWGVFSTKFFIQSWIFAISLLIFLWGFIKNKVSRKVTAIGIASSLCFAALFSILLYFGNWILSSVLPFGYSRIENIVYWGVALLSIFHWFPEIRPKLRNTWQKAMIPGFWEEEINNRKYKINSYKE